MRCAPARRKIRIVYRRLLVRSICILSWYYTDFPFHRPDICVACWRSLARTLAVEWDNLYTYEYIYGIPNTVINIIQMQPANTKNTQRHKQQVWLSCLYDIYYILFWIAPENIKCYYVEEGDECVCVCVWRYMDGYIYAHTKASRLATMRMMMVHSRALYNNKQPPYGTVPHSIVMRLTIEWAVVVVVVAIAAVPGCFVVFLISPISFALYEEYTVRFLFTHPSHQQIYTQNLSVAGIFIFNSENCTGKVYARLVFTTISYTHISHWTANVLKKKTENRIEK